MSIHSCQRPYACASQCQAYPPGCIQVSIPRVPIQHNKKAGTLIRLLRHTTTRTNRFDAKKIPDALSPACHQLWGQVKTCPLRESERVNPGIRNTFIHSLTISAPASSRANWPGPPLPDYDLLRKPPLPPPCIILLWGRSIVRGQVRGKSKVQGPESKALAFCSSLCSLPDAVRDGVFFDVEPDFGLGRDRWRRQERAELLEYLAQRNVVN